MLPGVPVWVMGEAVSLGLNALIEANELDRPRIVCER